MASGLTAQESKAADGLQPGGAAAEEKCPVDAVDIPAARKRGGEGVCREVSGGEYLNETPHKFI